MRLNYLYIERFMNLSNFELNFKKASNQSLYGEQLNLRFFIGSNGSGKSHVMEALGLIFSSLIYRINVDLLFAIEYELRDKKIRIVSTDKLPDEICHSWFNGENPKVSAITGVGVYIYVDSDWKYISDPWIEALCPSRVVAMSSGPISGFNWAMYERPLSYLMETVQGEWGTDQELTIIEREKMQADARTRWDAILDNPQTLVMNPHDSLYAVLAVLLLRTSESRTSRISEIVQQSGILPELGSFSLVISSDWRNKLNDPLLSRFDELLRLATVRWIHPQSNKVPDQKNENTEIQSDFLVAYDVTPELVNSFCSELQLTSIGLFLLLIACYRRGAIKDLHLGLVPLSRDGLLPEDALSDGEYLRLGRFCLLWMLREEPECLVLMDEPETHFNDKWKIELVSDIVKILQSQEEDKPWTHEVIIATHSSITLTDAQSNQVYMFVNGKIVPSSNTFGSDPTGITQGIYGANPSQGSFAVRLIEDAIQEGNIDLLKKLKDTLAPGYYLFRVCQILKELIPEETNASSD